MPFTLFLTYKRESLRVMLMIVKTVMSTRGRLTIPKKIRDKLGIQKGIFSFNVKENEVVIKFVEKR